MGLLAQALCRRVARLYRDGSFVTVMNGAASSSRLSWRTTRGAPRQLLVQTSSSSSSSSGEYNIVYRTGVLSSSTLCSSTQALSLLLYRYYYYRYRGGRSTGRRPARPRSIVACDLLGFARSVYEYARYCSRAIADIIHSTRTRVSADRCIDSPDVYRTTCAVS